MNLASLDIYHTLYLSEMHQTEKRMPTQAKGKDVFFFCFGSLKRSLNKESHVTDVWGTFQISALTPLLSKHY